MFDVEILGVRGKNFPSGEWKRIQLLALPTIARLANEHKVRLFTYDEIDFEGWKRSGGNPVLFHGVMFEKAQAAVERSIFCQSDIFHHIEAEQVISFVKFLLGLNKDNILSDERIVKRLSAFDLANVVPDRKSRFSPNPRSKNTPSDKKFSVKHIRKLKNKASNTFSNAKILLKFVNMSAQRKFWRNSNVLLHKIKKLVVLGCVLFSLSSVLLVFPVH